MVGKSFGDGESVLLHAGRKSASETEPCGSSSSRNPNDGRTAAAEGGEPSIRGALQSYYGIEARLVICVVVSVQAHWPGEAAGRN